MFDKSVTFKFLDALRHLEYGSMEVTTPDGKQHMFQGDKTGPDSTLILKDWRAIPSFAFKGDTGFAEAYRDGWWDSDNLTDLLHVGLLNENALDSYLYGSLIGRLAHRFAYLFTRNTVNGSKKNIHAHYDIGNDFYSLWLDKSMTYSSALYNQPNEDLLTAQHNKYDRILERLDTRSGNLLEIGCGWGGFAERAIKKHDYGIKGITLSDSQHKYASRRLGSDANIAIEDYRAQEGKYDNIVSIEMFEAVGEKFWPVYFEKLKTLLADKGKAVLQTITIRDDYFERYRQGGDVIRTYIFPGGMLPAPERFKEETAKAGLKINDTYYFGMDYARTLQEWLDKFESKLEHVRAQGFDEPFIRLWRFYLAACIASFKVGRTDVMQVELAHA